MHAPNAHNRQPWRFVVLTAEAERLKLADAMAGDFRVVMGKEGMDEAGITAKLARSRRRMQQAPVIVLLFADDSVMHAYADEERQRGETQMAAQSVALAGGQMLLAAHAEGLGGVWVCWPMFTSAQITKAFDLPEHWQAQGMLFLGYAAEEPKQRERLPLDEVVIFKS